MMLRCPECHQPFLENCRCGFRPSIADGIVDMTTAEQRAFYDPLVADYEKRRAEQHWGGEDLDLPEGPIGHRDYWAFRSCSFRALEQVVRKRRSGGQALDAGAGNCWLTRHIDRWGFDATALDINDGPRDGLRAGSGYITHGDHFDRVRGTMTDLPFADRSFDLVIAANSLHWSPDLTRSIAEFRRVLKPGGTGVVVDTPWFEKASQGNRRIRDRVEDLIDEEGLVPPESGKAPFLHRAGFDEATRNSGLSYHLQRVFFSPGRILETLNARFYQRALASFPILAFEIQGPEPGRTASPVSDG
jgi:SAM-dependent methyltransferase